MTTQEAEKLKWGTKLVLTRLGKDRFNKRKYQNGAIFLRNKGLSISVIIYGHVTSSSWSIKFWKVA